MERFFSGWADIVSRWTCVVFWIALVTTIAISKSSRSFFTLFFARLLLCAFASCYNSNFLFK